MSRLRWVALAWAWGIGCAHHPPRPAFAVQSAAAFPAVVQQFIDTVRADDGQRFYVCTIQLLADSALTLAVPAEGNPGHAECARQLNSRAVQRQRK